MTKYNPPPFNYCDYRCERCDKKDECTLYKRDAKRQLERILKGEDPYDMDVVLEDVDLAFQEAMNFAREFAKKEGIDLDAALSNHDSEDEKKREKKLRRHPFYLTAWKFYNCAREFLNNIEEKILVTPEIKEYIDDLVWYHTLIPAKTYRALSIYNRSDSVEIEDSVNTVELILNVISKCRHSIDRLCYYRPKAKPHIQPLSKTLNTLEKQCEKFCIAISRYSDMDK